MGHRKTFPIFAVILLVFAVTWLLREMKIIDINLPWLPIILIVIAIGIIFNRLIG